MPGDVGLNAHRQPGAAGDARLLVLYDRDCGFCSRTIQALRLIDHQRRRLRLIPLQRAEAVLGLEAPPETDLRRDLHARSSSGQWWIGGQAALAIADAVPIFRPLAWAGRLPVIRNLVEPGYRAIVENRDFLSRVVGAERCRYSGDQ